MTLLLLFIAFFEIGLFSFGGGYAMLPFIEHETVFLHHWISQSDFADVVALAQITPGPVAVNSATFVGTRVAGPLGAAVATFAVVLGPAVLILTVVRLVNKFSSSYLVKGALSGLRPALLALIAYSAYSIAKTSLTDLITVGVAVAALAVLLFSKVHPLIILAATAAIGGVFLR